MLQKRYKYIIWFVIAFVLMFACVLAGRYSTHGRHESYEGRIAELGTLLDNEATANRALIGELYEANKTVEELVCSINTTSESSESITKGLGDISGELSGDIVKLSDVIARFDYYIKEAETNQSNSDN